MKPMFRTLCVAMLALFVAAGPARAEKIIVKKTGRTLDGSIVERKGDFVKIVHSGGLGWYHLDDLESAEGPSVQPLSGLTEPDPRAIGYATVTAQQVVIPPRVDNYGLASGLQSYDLVEETADAFLVWLNHEGTNVLARISKRDRQGNENAQIVRGKLKVSPQRTPRLEAAPIVLRRGEEHPVVRVDDDVYHVIYKKGSFETVVPVGRSQSSYDFLSRELRFAREQREKGLVYYSSQWVTKEERSRMLAEQRTNPKPVSQLEQMKSERRMELLRAEKDRQRQLEEAQVRNLKKLQEGSMSYPVPAQLVARPPTPPVRIVRIEMRSASPGQGEVVRFTPVVHLKTAAGGPGNARQLKVVAKRYDIDSQMLAIAEENTFPAPGSGAEGECAFTPVGFADFDAMESIGYFVEVWNGTKLVDFMAEPAVVAKLADLVSAELYQQATAPQPEPEEESDTQPEGMMPGMMPGMPGPPPEMVGGFPTGGGESRETQEAGLIRNEVMKVLARNNIRGRPIEVQPDSTGQSILVVVSELPDMPDTQLATMHRQMMEQVAVVNPEQDRQIRVSLQTASGGSYPAAR